MTPLPVDVVMIWWDYFVDGVGIVSGVATAIALIYAAQTYRRQVDDSRRLQASKVIYRVVKGPDDNHLLEVLNQADQPIYKLRWELKFITKDGGTDYVVSGQAETAPAFHRMPIALDEYADDHKVNGSLRFCDASGKAWKRTIDGSLEAVKNASYYTVPFDPEHSDDRPWGTTCDCPCHGDDSSESQK